MQKEAEQATKELRRKEQEYKYRGNMKQDTAQDNLVDPPPTSDNTIMGGHLPLAELGLVPFTPSKHHAVACLDTIFFDPKKKTIVCRLEKRLRIDTQPEVVMTTDKIIVQDANQDPVFLASVIIAATQANADDVGKLVEDVEHYK